MMLSLLVVGLALLRVVCAQATPVGVTNPTLVFSWTPDGKPPVNETYVKFGDTSCKN